LLAKLAWVNGHLARLTGPERYVLDAISETKTQLPVARVIPRASAALAFGLGRPEREVREALVGLETHGLLRWDEGHGVALLVGLEHSQQYWCVGPQYLSGWFQAWMALPRRSLLTYAALVAIRRLVPLATETQSFARTWRDTFREPLFRYLVWGGLDEPTARRFAGVLTDDEICALPKAPNTDARRARDYRARRLGRQTSREQAIASGGFYPELPREWALGISPRFADSRAALGLPAADLGRAQGSAQRDGQSRVSGAAREDERKALPDPARGSGAIERERGSFKEISLSIWDLPVTDESALSGSKNTHGCNHSNSNAKNPNGQQVPTRHGCVTDAGVTDASRIPPSVTDRDGQSAGGCLETHLEIAEKQNSNRETPKKQSRVPFLPDGTAGQGLEGSEPDGKRKQWRPRLLTIEELGSRHARVYGVDRQAADRAPPAFEREGESGSRRIRRPRGVAPQPSAGAIAALSGWPRPK